MNCIDKLPPADLLEVERILGELSDKRVITEDGFTRMSEIAALTDRAKFTGRGSHDFLSVQAAARLIGDYCKGSHAIITRPLESKEEADELGFTMNNRRRNPLVHGKSAIAALIYALRQHQEQIKSDGGKRKTSRHTLSGRQKRTA